MLRFIQSIDRILKDLDNGDSLVKFGSVLLRVICWFYAVIAFLAVAGGLYVLLTMEPGPLMGYLVLILVIALNAVIAVIYLRLSHIRGNQLLAEPRAGRYTVLIVGASIIRCIGEVTAVAAVAWTPVTIIMGIGALLVALSPSAGSFGAGFAVMPLLMSLGGIISGPVTALVSILVSYVGAALLAAAGDTASSALRIAAKLEASA